MRLMKGFVLFVFIATITFYIMEKNYIELEEANDSFGHILTHKKEGFIEKSVPNNILSKLRLEGELYHWIGNNSKDLLAELGEPKRKDLSSYGYTWWVYTKDQTQYIQFGIMNDEIQTIFATGNEISIAPLSIGESIESVGQKLELTDEITYSKGISTYTFILDEEDLRMRPLVKLADNLFLQLYFDTFTEKLSSVRLLTGEILLTQKPYGLRYRGKLPDPPNLTSKEWKQVEYGMEQQIFDITNVIRNSFERSTLSWEEKVSEVAYLHSMDMAKNNYFSHYSQNGEGLKERLEEKDVYYFAAGENIAAQYVDAAAAVEGWLNSEGHREALLHDDYTHLGVGVYRLYYTQNFLTKPF
ncbi:CAP domain-containing protein [Ornithinibacillus californiensis]|uniref:CAP domain-containing protein n=1 Tax=Ornithinibacillus californiensis TaxID=161536 RepID=UPI00064D8DF9|nr:CAP domain-containing protein [Ornithinibacillus californiensis]